MTKTLLKPRLFWVLLGFTAAVLPFLFGHMNTGELEREVSKFGNFAFFETQYAYLYLHIFTFVPVFALSFDRRVHYFRSWWALFPAIAAVGLLFIVWDVYFTHARVWGFNERYLSGVFLWGLPMEEWLFFFTVPFACIFIYECLNYYVPWNPLINSERWITMGLFLVALIMAIGNIGKIYTAITFLLLVWLLSLHLNFWVSKRGSQVRSRFYMAYLVSCVPFILVNGVLTGGFTEYPIVLYNNAENLGKRLASIPLDDFGYSFLLLFGTVTLYEWIKNRKS